MAVNYARRRGLQKDDYINIAHLAILDSIKQWKPEICTLYKFAAIRIKRAFFEHIISLSVLRVPRPTWNDLSKLRKLTRFVEGNLESNELSIMLGKNRERVLELLDLNEILNIRATAEQLEKCFNKSREFDCIEIAPDIFPCLREVEDLLKFVEDGERKDLFARKYGLLGYKIHSYTELCQLTLRSKDYVYYQIVCCIKELNEIVNPKPVQYKACSACNRQYIPVIGRENRQRTCGDKKCVYKLNAIRRRLKRNAKNAVLT